MVQIDIEMKTTLLFRFLDPILKSRMRTMMEKLVEALVVEAQAERYLISTDN